MNWKSPRKNRKTSRRPVPETITVRVKPGSRKGPLVETDPDGSLTVYVPERAVDGKGGRGVGDVDVGVLCADQSRGQA